MNVEMFIYIYFSLYQNKNMFMFVEYANADKDLNAAVVQYQIFISTYYAQYCRRSFEWNLPPSPSHESQNIPH